VSDPRPVLLLGGTTKAASSALFAALAAHPGVAASRIKESRFFLDPDYPLEPAVPFERGLAAFDALFPPDLPGGRQRLRVEATPDLLHSPGSPQRVAGSLPGVRVAFVLREPVDRLWSWYRFARGLGLVRGDFATYLADQRSGRRRDQAHLALAQGDVAADLERWFKTLGRERVHVLFLENLRSDPEGELVQLATFAGLDPEVFRGRPLAVENETRAVHAPLLHRAYVRLAFRLRRWTHRRPALFALLGRAHRWIRPLYLKLNAGTPGRDGPPAEQVAELVAHYRPAVERLCALVGPVPWPRYDPRAGGPPPPSA
jgi:hypothetical protein